MGAAEGPDVGPIERIVLAAVRLADVGRDRARAVGVVGVGPGEPPVLARLVLADEEGVARAVLDVVEPRAALVVGTAEDAVPFDQPVERAVGALVGPVGVDRLGLTL